MNKKIYIAIIFVVLIAIGFVLFFAFNNNYNSGSIYLKINCEGKDISGRFRQGDKFKCHMVGEDYEFTIKEMTDSDINLQASAYGLFAEREDGTISLMTKVKDFTVLKDKELILVPQVTDYIGDLKILWE